MIYLNKENSGTSNMKQLKKYNRITKTSGFLGIQRHQKMIWLFLLFLLIINNVVCRSRDTVSFQVDMNKCIECGLFVPQENDIIIIRGSFNNWSGNEYTLTDDNHDHIFENSFAVPLTNTETPAEYKYVIIKANGRELYEKFPNPDNPNYGNRIIGPTQRKIEEFDIDPYHFGAINKEILFTVQELQGDFNQFRNILETEHCCLYEYTNKKDFDALFDTQFKKIKRPMTPIEFFKILTPITAKIGCGHTAVWMPGSFWNNGPNHLFPLQIHLIKDTVVAAGSYQDSSLVAKGSILKEINGVPINTILAEMRNNYSADAMNIHFINSQIERRFPLLYARRFGFKNEFQISYLPFGQKTIKSVKLPPAAQSAVRKEVFGNFDHPALHMQILDAKTVLMTIQTFIYYDRVPYFTGFIDSCFTVIRDKGIDNLILDVRGNDGGDPFCAAPLFSYLQKQPTPYFAEPYGKYAELAKPQSLPENHFTGNLYTLLDGRCFSTNGHFCALLKYHHIGKFIGTESGATFKCNAGKNTEFRLDNTRIMLYIGRSTFAAAVKDMDKTQPIMPDIPVRETIQGFIDGKDVVMEMAQRQIAWDTELQHRLLHSK